MSQKIYYITAGEYPKVNNLISSQVLSLLEKGESEGFDIEYISVIPILSAVKSFLKRKNDFKKFKQRNNIRTNYFYSWLNMAFLPSFIFRKYLLTRLAKKIIKEKELDRREESMVFHCRSYYATNLGIEIKNILAKENIKVIFDMRSILSGEFPFTFRFGGKKYYAEGKEWERYLLQKSSISLLPVQNGISLLEKENGPLDTLQYMPIIGFEYNKNFTIEAFDLKWNSKKISYIGSIGYWHSLELIETTLKKIMEVNGSIQTEIISNTPCLTTFDMRTIEHNIIKEYYNTLLATIIIGRNSDSYFESLKLRTNFFSTKASESLSLGIPIIVNVEIEELATFVKEYQCGIILRFEKDKVEFLNCKEEDLLRKEFWEELTRNSFLAGVQFREKSVRNAYFKLWKDI